MRVMMLGLLIGWMALAAEATGKWKAEFETQIGQQSYTYEFKVSGKDLTGKATHANGSSEIAEGRVEGDRVSFVENFEYQGNKVRIEYAGRFDGEDKIKFTRKVAEFAVEDLVASRVK